MITQRLGVSALRRAATKPNAMFIQNIPRLAMTQTRFVATEKLTSTEADSLLVSQRLKRPVSPHLAIYNKDQTFFTGSIWERITGATLSGAMYVFASAYLVAPLFGWHLESAPLAAAFGSLPLALKGSLKFLVAWPFAFHAINGVKQLVLDTGRGFVKGTFKRQGWAIWGASLVAGLYLGFLY